jgi:hypothetical protein
MKQTQFLKQVIEFNQTAFDNAFNATVMVQDQFEKTANTMLEQAGWMPSEGRKAIDNCVDAYKAGRDHFKKYVDESYQKAAELMAS